MMMDAFRGLPLPIEFDVISTGKGLKFSNMKIWEGEGLPSVFPMITQQSRYGKVVLSEMNLRVKDICDLAKKQVNQQIERVA
jgi:hypothetical protein